MTFRAFLLTTVHRQPLEIVEFERIMRMKLEHAKRKALDGAFKVTALSRLVNQVNPSR
jgi:hypothetical protein